MMGKFVRRVCCFIVGMISLLEGIEMKEAEYGAYVREIVHEFGGEVKKQFNLTPVGHGGSMPYNVRTISVELLSYRLMTLEEARALEVNVTKEFLSKINHHSKIQPFLSVRPFTPPNAIVTISFRDKDEERPSDGSIALVFQVKGIIYFFKYDPVKDDLVEIHSEPFEEAERLVASR